MLQIRKSSDRGQADFGWLRSQHSFSFGSYHDPLHNRFGPLLVINEDRVAPGQGFGTHGHRDMEIISYVLEGELAHKDSMGNGSVLRAGDVQRMSAGAGVRHSEFNHSPSAGVHFLQIWIMPNVQGGAPGYAERHVTPQAKRGRLCLIASGDGRADSLSILQDADVYASIVEPADTLTHVLRPGRAAYVHLVRGTARVNGATLAGGDAAKLWDEASVTIDQAEGAELLLFDLPQH